MRIRQKVEWLAILLGVGVGEFVLILYVLLGPARFEHAGLRVLATVGHVAPTDAPIVLPTGLVVQRVDSAGLYQRAIDVRRDQGVAAAESLYTAEFAATAGQDLPSWLANQAPHSHVQTAWQIRYGQDGVELGWMTSDAFRRRGLEAADGLYRMDIQHGRIASQDGVLTAGSQAWLVGQRTIADVGGWPTPAGRVMLAVLLMLLIAGSWRLLRVAGVQRLANIALVASVPLITMITFTLVDHSGTDVSGVVPDVVLYRGHAVLATVAERLGDSQGAALQWSKAARHVRTSGEVAEAARGLTRVGVGGMPSLRVSLCTQSGPGTPWGRDVLIQAGITC